MAFTQKLINVTFALQQGQFGSGSGNSYTVSGLRVSCTIVNPGGQAMGQAEVAIYGMSLSAMNSLTVLGFDVNAVGKNGVTITAGDNPNALQTVFQGTITTAYMDGQSQPNVCFRVLAHAGLYEAVAKTNPQSAKDANVATTMQGLAKSMGLGFENNGVTTTIAKLYLHGSPRDQALELARMAGIEWVIENNTLAIWNPGQARSGDAVLLSPQTGLVGYPSFNQSGVVVVSLFNPSLKMGGKIRIQSDITPACGVWNIYSLAYQLDSMVPRGKWFAVVSAGNIAAPEQTP